MDILHTAAEYDAAIGSAAWCGGCDYSGDGEIEIRYEKAGGFLAVHIRNLDTGADCYRLFRCAEEAEYDKKLVLSPSYEDELFCCIYEHSEQNGRTTALFMDISLWQQDLLSQIRQEEE